MSEEENIENNDDSGSEGTENSAEQQEGHDEDFSPEEFGVGIERFDDIKLNLKVLLGRVEIPVGQLLRITRGSILELKTHKDDFLEVTVNDKPVGESEIVIREDKVAVEIKDIFKTKKI